jgi:hypothetical protein
MEEHPMKLSLATSLAVAATLCITACGSNSNSPIGTGQFRAVNAIPDSQPIDTSISDISTGSTNNTSFGVDSGLVDVPEGSYKVQISATPASGGSAVTYTVDNVSIDHNNQTTVYAIGSLGSGTQSGAAVEENVGNAIPSGQVGMQFVNATTASAANGTVYIVTPGDTVAKAIYSTQLTAPATGSTTFYSTPTLQTAGNYEVIIQVGGVSIYDSGATTGISFPDGGNFQIAVIDATPAQITSNISPVQLLVMNNKDGTHATYLAGSNGTAGG